MSTKNSNSYICIDLPYYIKDLLYQYANEIHNQYPSFKIMEKESLHMTFLFLGPHQKYKDIQRIKDFMDTYPYENYEFDSIKSELFPPSKENLLIVRFKLSDNVTFLRKEFISALNMSNDEFIPHITLGKFVGKKENKEWIQIDPIHFVTNSLILKNPYF